MKKARLVLIVAVLIFGMFTLSNAEVPKLINYQGHLTDKGGNPLTGTFSIVFTIYDDATAGSSQWTETQSTVDVKNGLFSVLLGSVSVDGIPESVFDSPDRWLGIAVESDSEVTPRQQLVSVPYALKTKEAENGVPPGSIIMWSGSISSIPEGWTLCDGTNGTPNLQDRFIVGAGSNYSVDDTGGETNHNHAGVTGDHTLTIGEIPSHNHSIDLHHNGSGASLHIWSVDDSISTGSGSTNYTGGGQPHNHFINSSSNLPPYYALAYIMKL